MKPLHEFSLTEMIDLESRIQSFDTEKIVLVQKSHFNAKQYMIGICIRDDIAFQQFSLDYISRVKAELKGAEHLGYIDLDRREMIIY